MNSLLLRTIVIISAGLLIFEIIKGQYTVRLETANFIDFMIIIIAASGLILGIGIPETLSDDSD